MNGNSGFCLLLMIELCLAFVMGPGYMSCVTYGESFTPTFNDFFFGAMVALLLRLSRVRCFPKSLLAMMSFTLGAWSCAFPFLFWTCINVSLAWLSLVKGLRRAQLLTCRTVGRQRRVKRRRITFKRCKMTKVLLCVLMTSSLFLPLPQQTSKPTHACDKELLFLHSHIYLFPAAHGLSVEGRETAICTHSMGTLLLWEVRRAALNGSPLHMLPASVSQTSMS